MTRAIELAEEGLAVLESTRATGRVFQKTRVRDFSNRAPSKAPSELVEMPRAWRNPDAGLEGEG